jgi:hypothetical protein
MRIPNMGRGNDEKTLRRAQAQLDKAVARRDPEGAVEAVLGLDKPARQPLLERGAGLVRQMLPELQRQSAWGRLHALAARVEQEPLLVAQGADEAACAKARWLFFLASMRAKDFARASRFWQTLVALFERQAPALGAAVTAWLDGKGQLDSGMLAGLDLGRLPKATPGNPRLGNESSARPRTPPPAQPATVESVPDVVHLLFATQPLRQAGDTLLAWQAQAAPELASSMLRLAISLTMHEILIRAEAGERVGEAAQVLARLAQADPMPEAATAEIMLGLRFVMAKVSLEGASREDSEGLKGLLGALLRAPAFAAIAEVLARDLARLPPLAPFALQVCEHALACGETMSPAQFFPLWARALMVHCPPPQGSPEERLHYLAPAWLQSASCLAGRRGKELATFLNTLDHAACIRVTDAMAWGLPCLITVDLIDAAWDHAADDVRRELVMYLDELIMDAEDESIERVMSNPRSVDYNLVERVIVAAEAADPGLPFVGADGLKVWRRLGMRALPFNVHLLPFVLFAIEDPIQQFEAAMAYVGDRAGIEAWLEMLQELRECNTDAVAALEVLIENRILEQYRNDRASMAKVLIWGARNRGSYSWMLALARAYQDLPPGNGSKLEDERLAKKIVAVILKGDKKPRAKRRSASKPRKSKRQERKSPAQLELPLEEETP